MFVFLFLFLCVVKNIKHLLSILITLEILSLLVFSIFFFSSINSMNYSFVLAFLTVTARERVLGLVVFILFIQRSSKDYIKSLNVLKF